MGNLAPAPVVGVAPASLRFDRRNLARRQNLLIETVLAGALRTGGGRSPAWLSAADVPIAPRGGKGRARPLRARFEALRAKGMEPHPGGAELDGADVSHNTGATPNPDWDWAGWADARGAIAVAGHGFVLTLNKGDFTTVIAPVLLLTNATFGGVS